MTLIWTLSEHSQSHPEKPDFHSPTPAMILTHVCKLHHRHPSLPLWTCSLSTFWDPAKCWLPGHAALLGRAGLLSWCQHAVQTQETMYDVFWTFSRRAVVEQPNYPTTSDNAQGSGCGTGNLTHTHTHTHSVTVEQLSQHLIHNCAVNDPPKVPSSMELL